METQRRYRSTDTRNVKVYGGEGGFDYGKAVQTRVCLRCGKGCEVAGTSVWWGKGKWHRLNGDTTDHPAVIASMASGRAGRPCHAAGRGQRHGRPTERAERGARRGARRGAWHGAR